MVLPNMKRDVAAELTGIISLSKDVILLAGH
jgi:hypothetical protein